MAVFILTQLSQQATFSIEKLFAHKFLLSVKLEIWPGQPVTLLLPYVWPRVGAGELFTGRRG